MIESEKMRKTVNAVAEMSNRQNSETAKRRNRQSRRRLTVSPYNRQINRLCREMPALWQRRFRKCKINRICVWKINRTINGSCSHKYN